MNIILLENCSEIKSEVLTRLIQISKLSDFEDKEYSSTSCQSPTSSTSQKDKKSQNLPGGKVLKTWILANCKKNMTI